MGMRGRQGGGGDSDAPAWLRSGLEQAETLRRQGKHAESAAALAGLSKKAAGETRPGLATRLALRAARTDDGKRMEYAKMAIATARSAPKPRRMAKLIAQLADRVGGSEGQAIRAEAAKALGIDFAPGGAANPPAQKPPLPKQCEGCGWPVSANDVDWDEHGADCPMCGRGLAAF